MKVYQTNEGLYLESNRGFLKCNKNIDDLIGTRNLHQELLHAIDNAQPNAWHSTLPGTLLAPIGKQEVWASGVTYWRSRSARMEESKDSGGSTFYDKVYEAERPELFFKSAAFRVVPHQKPVRIRKDSIWNVPEPELTLVFNPQGEIIGYTIGNDMSSRAIEGENPLYLPQAKTYNGSCALGPCIYFTDKPFPPETEIELEIVRTGQCAFSGTVAVSQIRRKFEELGEFLFRELSFPYGCFLMTGTGIVPPNNFTLQAGDEIRIKIEPMGELINPVST
ncbi:MAG: hypothetical protein RLZZ241_764 [Bacteroidota bacterium]|jgi:2-dehydro-3-deoxy-D-arabinonate dehydratase